MAARVDVTSTSSVTLNYNFKIGNYYCFILGTFGADAETFFSRAANNKFICAIHMFSNTASGTPTYFTSSLAKYNNHIYWVFRDNVSTTSLAASVRRICLPYLEPENFTEYFLDIWS